MRSAADNALQTGVYGAGRGPHHPEQRTGGRHQVLDGARAAAKVLLADMLTEQAGDLVGYGVRLTAALRHRFRQYLEDQRAQNVAGHESERDAGDVFDHLPPFDPRPRHDWNIVVETCHGQHAGDSNRRRQEPDEDGAAQPDLVARTDQKPERQRDDHRGETEIERAGVQCDCDKDMGGNQQDDRNQDVGERVNDVEPDRRSYPFEARIDAVEVAMEHVELKNDLLDLENDRTHDPQIPGAMLADDRLVLDRLGAERAFHQDDRFFLRRRSASSSLLA